MAFPYIDTPRTDAGNATFLTNGGRSIARPNLDALDSMENSLQSPSKDADLIKNMRQNRGKAGLNLRTPRANVPLGSRKNVPVREEFTPMLKSVARNNIKRNLSSNRNGVPPTPAFLKDGGSSVLAATPGLPRAEVSTVYGDMTTDSMVDQGTPAPNAISSSPQSTPLANFTRATNGAILNDGHAHTLREQENIIDRIEKENFGLKMKIHFLNDALQKNGTSYTQAALKENTDLKVTKVELQRELHRYRKNLSQSEREIAEYRMQLEELRTKSRQRNADKESQIELERLRIELESRESEFQVLQEKLDTAGEEDEHEIKKLRDEVEDLEAELREKERFIDERDDRIEELETEVKSKAHGSEEMDDKVKDLMEQIEALRDDLDRAKTDAKNAHDEREQAVEDRARAEEDLQELQDEMANKSVNGRGLLRQLEDKASRYEEDVDRLRKGHAELKEAFEEKSRSERQLKSAAEELQEKLKAEKAQRQSGLELLTQDRNVARREKDELSGQLRGAIAELEQLSEQKDLLQSRHDALTNESTSLQRELSRSKATMRELEQALELERQHAQNNDHGLRSQHRGEIDRLNREVDSLRAKINEQQGRIAADNDEWDSQRRGLESKREKAEEQAAGLQRTIDKLQQAEGTLSSREMKLQEALSSEKQRHEQEEQVLNRQIDELNEELSTKRRVIEDTKGDLANTREELRQQKRMENDLRQNAQDLEDEIETLRADLEEEQNYAQETLNKAVSDLENQLHAVTDDKQHLRDQLANINIEIHSLRTGNAEIGAERDELLEQLQSYKNQAEDTFRVDHEKVELRKLKVRLEGEIRRLKEERQSLSENNATLQAELDSEIQQAVNKESELKDAIERLEQKLSQSSDGRDRELLSLKTKLQRFENRYHELENQMNDHSRVSRHNDNDQSVSVLRQDLSAARQKHTQSLEREAELKSSIKGLKARVSEMERQLHDANTAKLVASPRTSPSTFKRFEDEIRHLRSQLLEAHKDMKELRRKNREIEAAAVDAPERVDLHSLLKTSSMEAESLALKLSERETQLAELKSQVRRIREERATSTRRAELATRQLEQLQEEHDELIEEAEGRNELGEKQHGKELKGLEKQILWLKARLSREERMRKDLVWGKGLMVVQEQMRVECNSADLSLIAQMGVKPPSNTSRSRRSRQTSSSATFPSVAPIQKLRAAIHVVMATQRMQRSASEWARMKKLGEGLRKAKGELAKRRRA